MELVSDVAYSMGVELPEGVTEEQLLDCCNDVIKKHGVKKEETPAPFSLRAVQASNHDRFVNRVRVPDLSSDDTGAPCKYYYIKNVKTGQYLHMVNENSPMVTVAKDDLNDNSKFYFYNRGILGGISYEVLNCKSDGDVFYGPAKNKWGLESGYILANNSHPKFYFNVLEDGSGFYISDVSTDAVRGGEGEGLGDVWTCKPLAYNLETNEPLSYELISSSEVDEYAVWVIEALYETYLNTSDESDITWYVVRNVENGQYLHYNGAENAMTTVVAPDTCSLFYGLSNGTLGNYVAGDNLLCARVDKWKTTGLPYYIDYAGEDSNTEFYITEYGKQAYWSVDANGIVGVSPVIANNSKWQFEKITNFKEIAGMGGNWANVVVNDLLFECLGMLDSGKITPTQVYTGFIGVVIAVLYGAGSNFDNMDQIVQIQEILTTFDEVVKVSDKLLKEMSLFNADYLEVDEFGNMTVKGLATNTTSLIVNDMSLQVESEDESYLSLAKKADQRHTNMWQFYIKGFDMEFDSLSLDVELVSDEIYSVFYNTATRMYVSAPYLNEEGEYTVTMTSDESKAGRYSTEYAGNISIGDDNLELSEFANLLNGYYGALQFQSYDVENCYLYLPSAEDIALSCIVTEDPDTVQGMTWLYVSSTSVIDEKVYNHAQDALVTYPNTIQETFGLVKDASWITSNCPLEENYGNLLDNDFYTSFSTSDGGNADGELHYLQVDLQQQNAVAGFHFFIKANLNSYLNVPANITVSGSNDPEGEFVPLKENIEMPNLLYDMCYFSDAIDAAGYRYLRFTVNSVNAVKAGASECEFTLSEFYLYPADEYVEDAKNNINSFLDEEYIEIEIIDPTVALMKQKAEYLLKINKDNHAEEPAPGQYPTSKYNALDDAVKALDHTNQETIDNLFNALEDFINSLYIPSEIPVICVLESAWEEGFSSGKAFSFNMATLDLDVADVNIWDLRQWCKISSNNDPANPYILEVFALGGIDDAKNPMNLDVINGWNTMYTRGDLAYNIYTQYNGNKEYLAFGEEDGEVYITSSASPATTTTNKAAAWYLTPVSDADVEYLNNPGLDAKFIEVIADFGKTMTMAEYYYEGERQGRFVYVSKQAGLTYNNFTDLYNALVDAYKKGPVEIVNMYHRGEIIDAHLDLVSGIIAELKKHFPNFVLFNGYFRMYGRESGNYLVSTSKGEFSLAPMSDGDVELKSIFYTQPHEGAQYVNVVSYEDGRYMCVEDGKVKYDRIPEAGKKYSYQSAFVSQSVGTAGLDGNYFIDNGTSVTTSTDYSDDNNYKWVIETVTELPVVISSALFATFYCPMELQIPEGIVAYVLYEESEAETGDYNISTGQAVGKENVFKVKAIKGKVLPAATPVILQAARAGTYYFGINYFPTIVSDEAKRATYCDEGEDIVNLLHGRHEATYIPEIENYTHYVLANKDKGVGMYKVATNGSHTSKDGVVTSFATPSFYNNAHRAWLPMSNAESQRASGYVFSLGRNPGTTDIEENVAVEVAEDVIYDLQGRRLNSITVPGVYIVNGKRVFVK